MNRLPFHQSLTPSMQDDALTRWIFESHSRETLRGWARALRHVRFCRAFGGHANDGDAFQCSLRFDGEEGLLDLCRRLSLPLTPLPLDTPQPIPGRPYGAEEFQKFRTPIAAFPRYEQPGHTTLSGIPVFVWVGGEVVDIHLSGADGDLYSVTERDFQNAKRIDEELERLGVEFRDPPVNDVRCLSPRSWPELFA